MRFTVLKAVCLMSSFLLYACAHNLEKRPMEEFLVGYDYGMGGLWYYIKAKSREDILREYPDVGIWSNPAFFDQHYLDHIKNKYSYKLDEIPKVHRDALLDAKKNKSPKTPPSN